MMARSTDNSAQSAPASRANILFDELLVTMVQQGDKPAAERLFKRWNPRLLRSAWRYAGDAALAEQLAQDCWLAIWRGIGGLREPSLFAPWVFGILRHKGARQIAANIRERTNISNTSEADQIALAEDTDGRIAINQAFASLPPDQRLAAHLYFVGGLTLSEIAAVQSIPTGTAKSRLFHARRKLKAALKPEISEGEN
jgi:RNA polymerase sigma-70 factor (ECF subfamily)